MSETATDAVTSMPLTLRQRVLLGVIGMVSLVALYTAGRHAMADLVSARARAQVAQWQSDPKAKINLGEFGWMRNALVRSLEWTPENPQAYEHLGYLYGLRAVQASELPELSQALLDESILYYQEAITRRPMSPHAWASLAFARHLRGEQALAMWQAWDKAWQYGHRERSIQRQLAELVFARWEEAGAVRQDQIRDLVRNAIPLVQKSLLDLADRYELRDTLAPPALPTASAP